MRFTFRDVSKQLVPGPAGIELRLWAEFSITSRHETVYADDLFPVADFAMATQSWARSVEQQPEDFVFEDRLAFRCRGGAWDVDGERVELDELLDAIEEYYLRLRETVMAEFGFDLDPLVERAPRVARARLQ